MNWEIFSVILTGVAVYLGLRAQYREIKADVGAANYRIDQTNRRLDETWKELLVITRHFKTTENR